MAFYSIKEQDNPPGTETSIHVPQASEEPVIFQSRVTSGPYHIPTWLHYADGTITELKQVIKTVEDFLSVHPELDLNVKDQIFKTAAWITTFSPFKYLFTRWWTILCIFPNIPRLPSTFMKCAIDYFLDKLHTTKAERSVVVNCVPTVFPPLSSAPAPQVPHTFPKISIHQLNHLPTLPGYQCTRPEAKVASASTAAESMTIKANLLQGTSVKMDIDDQGTPSQMGHSLSTTIKSQKYHLRRSKTECPLSFESDRTDMFNAQSKQTKVDNSDNEPRVPSKYEKAQLRDPMFNNFLQAIDIPSLANFEGQPPSAILAASNYHTIKYLDQLSKACLHANHAEQSHHISKCAFTALAAKHAGDIQTPATNEEHIFMARYREVHRLNTENKAAADLAAAASSSAAPSGTSEAHVTHPAPTPTEDPVQTSTVMVGTIPITVTAPSVVPEGPEEDMQSTFSA
ncbi:hypothetical protein BT96DRAFT_996124 [Gymnopus androsaceus JB14]|uniref:Uncharacterized protein n=1 Tax=Gymnopus androsaceus JB14 TaxID=1447944 RepID=A0A6A4HGR2_9AGAR|nr:hypothetical protein BT96DRAFT_996124 [Gymnopus androsaceus JB14]